MSFESGEPVPTCFVIKDTFVGRSNFPACGGVWRFWPGGMGTKELTFKFERRVKAGWLDVMF